MRLSKTGFEILQRVMAELEMERPDVLRLAFAKGLTESELIREREKEELANIEIPMSVIAKGDDVKLIKHLIIDKMQTQINDESLDKLIISCIEQGLVIMDEELNSLTGADSYLFYLLEKHGIA
ncbi:MULTISPECIES: DndE family protein [Geobacillus]|jgi:DNA sulfur modification protein DndE|uniref:DndE family protein n=1 Tax=Geobacillus TaxID=129337 RepID=UPI001CC206A2|nr:MULTISPECIES: DndE family protein [Geobacillus]MED3716435.1 DndE family protein [Geobacillus thermodenitrificans]